MNTLRVINQQLPQNVPSIKGRNIKGYFTVSEDQPYYGSDKMIQIPTILPDEKRNQLIWRNLREGYTTAIPLINYAVYYKMKEAAFLKWLCEYYMPETPPNFICFGGRIADTLCTPIMSNTDFDKWDFYATKCNNTVILWTEAREEDNSRTLQSYQGKAFEALLLGQNPAMTRLDETKHTFVCQERKLGKHKLLLVSDIDGIDQRGNWIEIKACKETYIKTNTFDADSAYKFRKCWAQSVVAGQTKAVYGGKEDKFLKQIVEFQMKDLLNKAGMSARDVRLCYDFQTRLLKWIQTKLEPSKPFSVLKFSWQTLGPGRKMEEVVRCSEEDATISQFAQQLSFYLSY